MSKQGKKQAKNFREKKLSLECLESRQLLSALPITSTDSDVIAATAPAVINDVPQVDYSALLSEGSQYGLQPNAEAGVNSTMETARDLGTIHGSKVISAKINGPEDYGWFKFTLPVGGISTSKVLFSYTPSTRTDLDLILYDANGNELVYSGATSGPERISLDGKEAGTYYLKITNYKSDTASVPYTVRFTLQVVHFGNPSDYCNLKASNGGSLSSLSVTQGDDFTVTTGAIKNIGVANSKAGTVNFYASKDGKITSEDTLLGSVSLEELAQKESITLTESFNTAGLDAGKYYIGWIVESSNDSTTSNNTGKFSKQLTITEPVVPAPDLQANIGRLATISVTQGTPFDFMLGPIKNIGTETAEAGYKVTVYASKNMTVEDSDIYLGEWVAPDALAAGESAMPTITGLPTADLDLGSYYIVWSITGVDGEINVANNTSRCVNLLTVKQAVAPVVDLQATNGGSLSAATVTAGDKFTLTTGSIRNIGTAAAEAGYKVTVYASKDTALDVNNDICVGEWTASDALEAGASVTAEISDLSTENLDLNKPYYILWTITGVNGETVTTNNTARCTSQLKVIPPVVPVADLQTSNGGQLAPTTVTQGETSELSGVTIENVGTAEAEAGFKVTVYASTNTTIDANDTAIGEWTATEALAVGTPFELPAITLSTDALGKGTYYVGWTITEVNGEAVTTNNTARNTTEKLTVNLPVVPVADLQTSNGGQLAPTTVTQGETSELSGVTIENVGTAAAQAGFKVTVYASKDTTINDKDTLIGEWTATEALAVGTPFELPAISLSTDALGKGTYYVGWTITGVNGEAVTTNNTARNTTEKLTVNDPEESLAIIVAKDVSGELSPSSVVKGKTTDLKIGKITNAGTATASAGSYKVTVYAKNADSEVSVGEWTGTKLVSKGTVTPTIKLSTENLTAGEYTICWAVSKISDNVNIFSDQRMGSATLTVIPSVPDLKASEGGSLPKDPVIKGNSFTITNGKIENKGTATAEANYKIKVYASKDSNSNDIELGEWSVTEALEAGKTKTLPTLDIPTDQLTVGESYNIYWTISGVNGETDTSNNTAMCQKTLTVVANAPDLCASDGGKLSNATVENGAQVKITTGTIQNIGGIKSNKAIVTFYAFTDLDSPAIELGKQEIGSLKPNASTTTSLTFTCTLNQGEYYIGWIVESEGEISTGNNYARYAKDAQYAKLNVTKPVITSLQGYRIQFGSCDVEMNHILYSFTGLFGLTNRPGITSIEFTSSSNAIIYLTNDENNEIRFYEGTYTYKSDKKQLTFAYEGSTYKFQLELPYIGDNVSGTLSGLFGKGKIAYSKIVSCEYTMEPLNS